MTQNNPSKQVFRLVHQEARNRAAQACLSAPDGYVVRIIPPTRSLEANSKLWAMLSEVAEQVCWHGRYLTAENWKHIFTASLKKQEVVPGIDSDFVILGTSTSRMTKAEMSNLIELISAFGASHAVIFKD